MTQIQQVMWELTVDYIGHPYYVTGNAILSALHSNIVYDEWRKLRASHGMFTPGTFGAFPDHHNQSGARVALGSSLVEPEAYDDLFLHRHPEHQWLLDGRPRDALNAHSLRKHHGTVSIAPKSVSEPPMNTITWYIQAHLSADDDDVLPIDDWALDQLQFGGKRNYGYGEVELHDTQLIDLDRLDYSRLENADRYLIRLLTPYITRSEYPDTDDSTIPWWWDESEDDLRHRTEKLIETGDEYDLVGVDHGQAVLYTGESPIETARNGLTRTGTHSKYGYGEFRIKPISDRSTEK